MFKYTSCTFSVPGLTGVNLHPACDTPRTEGLNLAFGCSCLTPTGFARGILPVSLRMTFGHLNVQHEYVVHL